MNANPDPTTSVGFYVSTAIPYVNAAPHVGFAYEAVLADVLARHQRLCGRPVHLQSGTDDNSLKNVQAAEREGVSPAALVADNARRFLALAGALGLSYDDFIRTGGEARHRDGVEALWAACARAGDLYRRRYRGLYCVGCEGFYEPADLQGGRCPEHGTAPEPIEEDNWSFRLSRYRDPLVRLIEQGQLQIAPRTRRNEVLGFLAGGLEDISVSRARARARGWGIPVPGDPEQVVYVWFDALSNYINTLGWAHDGQGYRRFWANGGRRLHVLGKGILRFHAVHWPALLLSAGLPLPTDLLVHGYLTVDGRKIGKSLGNAIDPQALVARHGTDVVRHYLLRHIRPFEDTDFSETRLVAARDAELADQLGNLVRRTVTLVQRSWPGHPPRSRALEASDEALQARLRALPGRLEGALGRYAVDEGLAAIFEAVAASNRYLEQTAPWTLARAVAGGAPASDRLRTVLHHALEAVRIAGLALAPFLPATSAAIGAQLGQGPPGAGDWPSALAWGSASWSGGVPGGPVLFAKTTRTGRVT
jgi:methionyl-tRNA synthetase